MGTPFIAIAVVLMTMGMTLDAKAGDAPREVSFATADSGMVTATLSGGGDRGVVLAHGAAFNKESWADLADSLSAHGFRALAIDFRGYGKSVAGRKERGRDEDVLAAIRYLSTHGATSVSIVGGSMGGGASALAATEARPGEITHLVLLSPVSIPHPERIQAASVVYIASRDERMAPGIQDQFRQAPEPKRLLLLDGSAHAQNIFKTDQGPRLTQVILEALEAAPRPLQK